MTIRTHGPKEIIRTGSPATTLSPHYIAATHSQTGALLSCGGNIFHIADRATPTWGGGHAAPMVQWLLIIVGWIFGYNQSAGSDVAKVCTAVPAADTAAMRVEQMAGIECVESCGVL